MKVKRRRKSTRGEEEVSENDAKKEEEKEEKQIYYPRSIYFFPCRWQRFHPTCWPNSIFLPATNCKLLHLLRPTLKVQSHLTSLQIILSEKLASNMRIYLIPSNSVT